MVKLEYSRRSVLAGICSLVATAGAVSQGVGSESFKPRTRVIIDNDFAGDPDGLFQTAHHLLSPSSDIRLIIGSHLHADEKWLPQGINQAAESERVVRELLEHMPESSRNHRVLAGAKSALSSGDQQHVSTAASGAIIEEALKSDLLPLYYCAGAGLTDLATAWSLEPKIASRMILVWIGGPEYNDLALPPPGSVEGEYNMTIDIRAAQIIFGKSDIPIWQVPRSTYRKLIVSYAELVDKLRMTGELGGYLIHKIQAVISAIQNSSGMPSPGETYVLGDSPLVTLTALQSAFQPDATSSRYVTRPCPTINDSGGYVDRADGRPIRVYTDIDQRLTFDDLFAKLRQAGRKHSIRK